MSMIGNLPFVAPFGLAWLGFVFWIIVILIGLWLAILVLPWLLITLTAIWNIVMLPLRLVGFGGAKRRVNLKR